MSESAVGPSDNTSAGTSTLDEGQFGRHHVYEPHRAGLPKLTSYGRELWMRRQFIYELARSALRAQNYSNAFGQLWLILNPLLLAFVYYVLVTIIRQGNHPDNFFPHLVAGLFVYYFVSGAIMQSANSVVGGGRLILNTAFPRLMLPVSQVLIAFMRFLPTFVIFAILHTILGIPVSPVLFWVIPILAMLTIFAAGVGFFFATLQVYFRDTANFLPYMMRIWLYTSPILWTLEQVEDNETLSMIVQINPLAGMLGAWSDVLVSDQSPQLGHMLLGTAWSLGALVIGALFFMSREREFAVRI